MRSESPLAGIKGPSKGNAKPQGKRKIRIHRRSHSQQQNMMKRSRTIDDSNGIYNLTEDTSQASSAVSSHKRSISKDQIKKVARRLPHPLLNSSYANFNKRYKKMLTTQLEIVEDIDEKNSTSQWTSVQQNNLKDLGKIKEELKNRLSRDFFHDHEDDVSIEFHDEDTNLDK